MISTLFTNFGWSRDDAKWTWGILIACVVALATLNDTMITTLGLPLAIVPLLPWCRLIAFIVGVVSGTMKTSNLFAKGQVPADAGSVDVSKRMGVVLLVGALGAGVLVSSCATFRALPISDQVRLELDAAEWGVKADHDFGVNWLSDVDVAVFNHIDDTIRQVLATNPPNPKAAARAAAIVELAKLPADSKLRPYVDALGRALA